MRMLYEADPVFLLLFLALLVGTHWPLLLVGLTVAAYFCRQWQLREARRQQEAERDADLVERADEQQSQVLDGDPRGHYGVFPPAVVTCVQCGLMNCVCAEIARRRRKPWLTLSNS